MKDYYPYFRDLKPEEWPGKIRGRLLEAGIEYSVPVLSFNYCIDLLSLTVPR